jgi:hypothetical protein
MEWVMTFNPDEPHDGWAETGAFTYRMVHVGPDLIAPDGGLPLFRAPVVADSRLARAISRLHAARPGA